MNGLNAILGFKKTAASLCLGAALCMCTLTGCTNISDDGTRTKTEGTLAGAGIGAALGAAIGALAGKGKGAAIGAAIGAGVGGAGGYMVGSHVAEKKAEYASREDLLNDRIARVRDLNEQSKIYNASLRKTINNLDKELSKLRAKNATVDNNNRLYRDQRKLNDLKTTNEQNIAFLKNEVSEEKALLAQAKAQGSTNESRALEAEIKSLENQLREMNTYQGKLNRMTASIH
ncbi:MAG: hypothetical protein K6F05_04815 [Succinivibrio sp.]|nr:hypothetical protein [Succinivibrio sp.]